MEVVVSNIYREMAEKHSIRLVEKVYRGNRIDLPNTSGVYAFWWMGEKEELLASNTEVILKGPNKEPVKVIYNDWWPADLAYPCLYVGKSTNIKNRFGMHIKNGSESRLHEVCANNQKAKPKTTSCQLRHGIEHIFPKETAPLRLIKHKVGFSYNSDFFQDDVAKRFFEEDLLIGLWRPWFNVDSER